jgi:hypothetical protein
MHERVQDTALVAIEADARSLVDRTVHAHVGNPLQPRLPLVVEVGIIQEGAAIDEVAAQVADRTLDFAFGLGAIGPTRAGREAPVLPQSGETRDCAPARRPPGGSRA